MHGLRSSLCLILTALVFALSTLHALPESRVTWLFQSIQTGASTPHLAALFIDRLFTQLMQRPLTPEEVAEVYFKLETDYSEERRDAFFHIVIEHGDRLSFQLLPEFKSLAGSESPFQESRALIESLKTSPIRRELALRLLSSSELCRRTKPLDRTWAQSVLASDVPSDLDLLVALKAHRRLDLKPELLPHLFRHLRNQILGSPSSPDASLIRRELSLQLQRVARASYQDADGGRSNVESILSLPPSTERTAIIQSLRDAQRALDRNPLVEAILDALEKEGANFDAAETKNLLSIVSYNSQGLPKAQRPRLRRLLTNHPEWAQSKEGEVLRMQTTRLPLDVYICWRAIKNSIHRRLKK